MDEGDSLEGSLTDSLHFYGHAPRVDERLQALKILFVYQRHASHITASNISLGSLQTALNNS